MGNEAKRGDDAMEVDQSKSETKKEEVVAPKQQLSVVDLLCQNIHLLEEAVHVKETSLCLGRLLRQTTAVRKKMTERDIAQVISTKIPKSQDLEKTLEPFLQVNKTQKKRKRRRRRKRKSS